MPALFALPPHVPPTNPPTHRTPELQRPSGRLDTGRGEMNKGVCVCVCGQWCGESEKESKKERGVGGFGNAA